MEPLVSYDEEGAGDYYLLAKNSEEEIILEPYIYEVDGKEVMMTSVVVPIKVDGKVLGAAGVDISLESLQSISDETKLMKTGYAAIISNSGIYAAHPKKELVASNIFDSEELEQKEEIKQAVAEGSMYTSIQRNRTTGEKIDAVF